MKLANALSQRAELQTRIRQLENRLYNNAQVQEGEQPSEDPEDLLRELEEDYSRLEELISAINRTPTTPRSYRTARPSPICWPGGTVLRDGWVFCGTSWTAPAPWSAATAPVRSG